MKKDKIMQHTLIGYRRLEKTRYYFTKIHENITKASYIVDCHGICLD